MIAVVIEHYMPTVGRPNEASWQVKVWEVFSQVGPGVEFNFASISETRPYIEFHVRGLLNTRQISNS